MTIGPQIVLASHPFWRSPPGDFATHTLGAEAFLRDPAWHFPLDVTARLMSGGHPVAILFMDSAPWIAILAKAVQADWLSVVGLTAALSVILQPVSFVLLLLALGVRRWQSLVVGTALGSLLPAWYMRLGMHVALSSHWLPVLALALAVKATRQGLSWGIVIGLAVLGAVAFGIHVYLFVMIAAIALAALTIDVFRFGRPAAKRAGIGVALFVSLSAISAWTLVYGATGGVSGFGYYSMNLASPFFPQNSGILKAIVGSPGAVIDATGGQYEGFNYLGAGILVCLVAAACIFLRKRPQDRNWRPALPLILTLSMLALFATSNVIFFRSVPIMIFPLPPSFIAELEPFRASGRMFWPVAYMLLAWSLMLIDALPSSRTATIILVGALLAQAIDTAPARNTLRKRFQSSSGVTFDTRPLRQIATLRFIPAYACTNPADAEASQVALVVERAGGRVEDGPIGRLDPRVCDPMVRAPQFAGRSPGTRNLLIVNGLSDDVIQRWKRSSHCVPLGHNLLCGANPNE
ncbi:MAG: hypothetical protein ACJ8FB_12805 [Sphingomicrobium sp.]